MKKQSEQDSPPKNQYLRIFCSRKNTYNYDIDRLIQLEENHNTKKKTKKNIK